MTIYATYPCLRKPEKSGFDLTLSAKATEIISSYQTIEDKVLQPFAKGYIGRKVFAVKVGISDLPKISEIVVCETFYCAGDQGEASDFCTVTFSFEVDSNVSDTLQKLVSSKMYFKQDTKNEVTIEEWLDFFGYKISSSPKFSIFSNKIVEDHELKKILTCHNIDQDRQFTGDYIAERAAKNIAQFSTAKIFASNAALFEFQMLGEGSKIANQVFSQIATVYMVEIQMLKISSLSWLELKILNLKRNVELIGNDDLVEMNQVFGVIQRLLRFDHFRMLSSRELNREISNAFNILSLEASIIEQRASFEQLVSLVQLQSNERENKSINKLLIFLAVLQVLPVIYSTIEAINDGRVVIKDLLVGSLSAGTCFCIYLVFRLRTKSFKTILRINNAYPKVSGSTVMAFEEILNTGDFKFKSEDKKVG